MLFVMPKHLEDNDGVEKKSKDKGPVGDNDDVDVDRKADTLVETREAVIEGRQEPPREVELSTMSSVPSSSPSSSSLSSSSSSYTAAEVRQQ